MAKRSPADVVASRGRLTLAGVPQGFDALVIADLARQLHAKGDQASPELLVVCRDGPRMQALETALGFFAPGIEILTLPAWDCQPYDRASPNASIMARRMLTLSRLARITGRATPAIVLTTINAALQRLPAKGLLAAQSLSAAPGNVLSMANLSAWLENNGYLRTSTVREVGEYAVRGGILDLYPPGLDAPIRLDFFGDTLESIRAFDPESQRTTGQLKRLDLVPTSEVQITTETMVKFRLAYVRAFGGSTKGDALYEAVSEGRRHPGVEHWLPLFHDRLDTIFDYLPGSGVVLDALVEEAAKERLTTVADYYDARKTALDHNAGGVTYKPLPPDQLYLTQEDWDRRRGGEAVVKLSPFALAGASDGAMIDLEGRRGHSFAAERADENANVFDAVVGHIAALRKDGKRIVVAAWSEGSRDRLLQILGDHHLRAARPVASWGAAQALRGDEIALAVLGLEEGFETPDLAVIGEQDILGDRLVRAQKKRKRAQDFIAEATSLSSGDLVVHVDHGIGRFIGLRTVTAVGAPHDCVEIHYAGGDKLFLPVENIELLSRYGSEDAEAQLDKLGGGAWQARKARLKKRILEMAGELIKIAAARALREAPKLIAPDGAYDEFAARFPYDETEDQAGAIDAVLEDLGSGRPMDRLICGDVGFGKTEVALRAAFASVMNGKQVAVVVPTTLLARQHFKTFSERFKGLPINVAQASRMVGSVELAAAKKGLTEGTVDIVVGTHALLGKAIAFKDLGLVIVDEEQHFGVGHKERLKQLRAEVHVLTLTATPIPRTLQLAMTGVRDLSIIATPPVDRLAVRSFVTPFDALIVREALLRERYRGGQAFFVCPRIEDLGEVEAFLREHVPEAKFIIAHGQMAASELEDRIGAFYEGKVDILVSTTIVESGLDIPTANTLIIWRADMFGLAQLYQLRGRVGRSKTRAYALFTLPESKPITPQAERRLKVLQSLDTLGAGFQLASHDLDIRGAGNLLGDDQSGHIKEVGYELYQQMLEEAVAMMKAGGVDETVEDKWSPQITVGTPILIPDHYVEDLSLRLSLYRRLGDLETDQEIDAFAAEMIDRFGPLPDEVQHLVKVAVVKALCRRANVDKVDAGPRGIVLSFRDQKFANPAGLVRYIGEQGSLAKVRPDQKIVFIRDWPKPDDRLRGAAVILRNLVKIAETRKAA
ncbi:MAG: transcription-repair coupling factor [Phreatobacter sp.]